MRRLALLLLLAAAAGAAPSEALVHLADGRVLFGRNVERGLDGVVLVTDFGRLRIPKAALAGRTDSRPAPPPTPPRRSIRTKWIEIECDLSEERGKLYADQLDTFFDWMVKVYELEPKRVMRGVPYRMHVYRRRADFKRVQAEVAPGIEQKGQAFAEGVAGFYSPGSGRIYLWDAEGAHGGVHLGVAKHETTHLLNHLLARQLGLRVPTWFEEGAATYFQMFVPTGGKATHEPDDHPGAHAQVVGEIERGAPMRSRELRAVPWAEFHGREYSWGWALIRFFRRHEDGRIWPAMLKYLRTVSPVGGVTDSEERRFLKSTRFKTSEAFDRAWHAHLRADRPKDERAPIGTSPEMLARIAALKRPDEKLARNYARIGISLARARESAPAIVYLRAALRGDVRDPEVAYQLAVALAEREDLTAREPWPAEAIDALRRAVEVAPLRSVYRLALGAQLTGREARDMLGLALVLAGPDDDDVALALGLLRAAAQLAPDRSAEQVATALADSVPPAAGALRASLVYLLQETEDWDQLGELLTRRVREGNATFHERAMLAGLYRAGDELEEAVALYRGLLAEDRAALRLWPDLVDCLARLGRKADAREARDHALQALRDDPRELGWIRRRLERLDLD